MKNQIISNIIQSFIEKFFVIGSQLILSILLVRLLDREDYGIVGVVVGYYVFVNFVNISLEAIILRDHKEYSLNLDNYFINFFAFSVVKSICFVLLSGMIAIILVGTHDNQNFIYSIISVTVILIADSLVAPILIYTTSIFKQKVVTKIAMARAIINVILTCGLFVFPSLEYIAIKDCIVSVLYIVFWVIYAKGQINYSKVMNLSNYDYGFIKKSLLGYSLWTHLNGVVTSFIYRSDMFFLSFFTSLSAIGDYNIALNSANVANIVPMIFGYQNSVALSHAKDIEQANHITNTFIRISIYVGVLTVFGFVFLGKIYLYLMTGQSNVDVIYSYMLPIVIGLVIVKTFASPLNAYINIKGSVNSLFKSVLIPVFVVTILSYLLSSFYLGPSGVALANILVAMIWLILIIKEIKKYHYNFASVVSFSEDIQFVRRLLVNANKR